jgi:hypothetical protein
MNDKEKPSSGELLPTERFSPQMYETVMKVLGGVALEQIPAETLIKSLADAKHYSRLAELKGELGSCAVICMGGVIRSKLLSKLLSRLGFSLVTPAGFALSNTPKVTNLEEGRLTFNQKPVDSFIITIDAENEIEMAGLHPLLKRLVDLKSQASADAFDVRFILVPSIDVVDDSDTIRLLMKKYFPEDLQLI